MLLIRSRVHAALKDWNQAEHDVSRVHRDGPKAIDRLQRFRRGLSLSRLSARPPRPEG